MAYWVLKAVLTPILSLLWRVRVEGRHHVPRRGPVILAANHQSFCDSFFIPLVLRRRVTYVAKAEYFESWRTAWFFRAAGQIPIRRDGGSASQRALDTAGGVLSAGGVLGIYPEGTRAPDPRLFRGHTGACRLAAAHGVSIVPIGLVGTRRIQPPGRRLMRPFHTVVVRFGPPMAVTCAADDGAGLRRATDALMAEIARLSGQELADVYARRPAVTRLEGGAGAAPDLDPEPAEATPAALVEQQP